MVLLGGNVSMESISEKTGSRWNIRGRFSLFAKMNSLILILILPIVLAYTYSNDVTFHVVSGELQSSSARQLTFLSGQIDSRVSQMMDFSLTFSKDPNVQDFNGLNLWGDAYDRMQTRYAVQEKMVLQYGVTDIWPSRYTLHSQQNQEVISNYSRSGGYDEDYLKRNMSTKWSYGDEENSGAPSSYQSVDEQTVAYAGNRTGAQSLFRARSA